VIWVHVHRFRETTTNSRLETDDAESPEHSAIVHPQLGHSVVVRVRHPDVSPVKGDGSGSAAHAESPAHTVPSLARSLVTLWLPLFEHSGQSNEGFST